MQSTLGAGHDVPQSTPGVLLPGVLLPFRAMPWASASAIEARVVLGVCRFQVAFANAPLGRNVTGKNRPDKVEHVLDALLRPFQLQKVRSVG